MIEKIQRLINQDLLHNKNIGNLIIWIKRQDKLIRKYPANRREGVINKLLSVDRSVMSKEQINTLIEEIEGKRANVDIIQAFEAKKTNEEIAQQFSVSQETVRQWRKLYGYSKPNGKKMSDEQLLQALGDGKTNKEIAEMFEITTGAVSKRVKKMTT